MSDARPDAGVLADRLVRRLLSVEGEARAPVAQRVLLSFSPELAVDILAALLDRQGTGDARAAEALAAVGLALSSLGEGDAATDLYACAQARHREDVSRLLMRPAPARTFDEREETSVDREMRKITIGMRRQMARAADPVTLTRLMPDPDAGVIKNLLRHPRLTEPEVVRIAARRPARPEVLREIYQSNRWSVRRRVRIALVNNPYTPTEIALKLVPLLPLPDVKGIVANQTLHAEVLRSAKQRLADAQHRRKVAQAAAHLADLEPEGDA